MDHPRYSPIGDAPADAMPPPIASPPALAPLPPERVSPRASLTPHIGHALLFALFVVLAGVLSGIGFAFFLKPIAHSMHESAQQMQTDPRVVIPLEAVMYALAAAASLLIFPLLWARTFAEGVHWRASVVRRRWWLLAAIGIATSVVVQVLSNFLPIPKELPIDKFFTNRIGVWLVAVFGVTVAPAFEELAFRGFLLPSLASAWDWMAQRGARERLRHQHLSALPNGWAPLAQMDSPSSALTVDDFATTLQAEEAGLRDSPAAAQETSYPDPHWSLPALVFSSVITSIGFALLHGGQLAHSFAPLSVLFVVSLVLCTTRLRFQSLAASTLVHSLYNATIFLMLFIGTDGFRHLEKLSK